MKNISLLIACFFLASCAEKIPRAIIPPPSEIAQLDARAVSDASKQTRFAVRDIAAAGSDTRQASAQLNATAEQLRVALKRAEDLAADQSGLKDSFAQIRIHSVRLSDDLAALRSALSIAEDKERRALNAIDAQEEHVSLLNGAIKSQLTQILAAKRTESVLRDQVEQLSASVEKRIIAEEKLSWWRKAAGLTWLLLLVYAAVKLSGLYFSSSFLGFLPRR